MIMGSAFIIKVIVIEFTVIIIIIVIVATISKPFMLIIEELEN